EPEPSPSTLARELADAGDRRPGDDGERDPLADVPRVAVQGVEERAAHRAGLLHLRPEHEVVEDEDVVIAEELAQADGPHGGPVGGARRRPPGTRGRGGRPRGAAAGAGPPPPPRPAGGARAPRAAARRAPVDSPRSRPESASRAPSPWSKPSRTRPSGATPL